jgi:uncharacterized membrane protein YbhN (UPF0104 family)
MKILKVFKPLLLFVFISALISAAIGLAIPRGLLYSGAVIILVLINRIYIKGEENLLISDVLFVGSILSLGIVAFALIYLTCVFAPHWTSCTPNSFRATVFLLIFWPIAYGCILWIALRFPMIYKALFKK